MLSKKRKNGADADTSGADGGVDEDERDQAVVKDDDGGSSDVPRK